MLPSLAFWAPRRWRRIWHLSAATSLRASITSTGNSPSQHEVLANMCSSWRQNPDSYPHGLRCFAKKASITPVSSRCGDNRESPLPLLGKGTGQGGGRRETGKMVVSVAPMVDVTGRHFRYLMRLLSRRTTLWTPMLPSVRVAKRSRREVMEEMLRFHPSEGRPPLVAQLGGDDPRLMLAAGRRCEEAGYGEVNINLGCPARNAQAANYGAALMRPPHGRLVAMVREMTEGLRVPVSVKLRIGVDSHDSYAFLLDLVQQLHEDGGCNRFVVHARKALLGGLPPEVRDSTGGSFSTGVVGDFVTTRQNRLDELVPLRWDWVHRLRRDLSSSGRIERMEINGGIKDMDTVRSHLQQGMDGVMLGRLARDDPFYFSRVDPEVFGDPDPLGGLDPLRARCHILSQYADYAIEEARKREASRELLLQPLNRMFEAPGLKREKAAFAEAVRPHRVDRGIKRALGEDVHTAVEMLLGAGGGGWGPSTSGGIQHPSSVVPKAKGGREAWKKARNTKGSRQGASPGRKNRMATPLERRADPVRCHT